MKDRTGSVWFFRAGFSALAIVSVVTQSVAGAVVLVAITLAKIAQL